MHQGINTVTDKIIYTEIGYPIIQSKHITKGFLDLDTARFVSKETFDRYKGKYNPKKGNILFCNIGSIGQNLAIYENADFVIAWNLFLIELNEEKVFPKFLSHYLFYLKGFSFYDRFLTGGTIKFINKKKMSSLTIPLPPLPIQQQIADLLDTADALRRTTAEQLQQLDDLAESVFLEMFGDPVGNEKGWEISTLITFCNKITDGTHDTPKRLTEGVKFITGKHIRPFKIDYDNSDYVTIEEHKGIYRRCNPEFGDILYTNIGANVGNAAMNTVDYEFSMKNVALLKLNKIYLTGRYVEALLNNVYFFNKIQFVASLGGAQQFLSLKEIKRIIIPIPPIKLQNEFTKIIKNIELQKVELKQSLQDSEDLFKGLLQEIFN
jgi:type I restriction enzyme S subunit